MKKENLTLKRTHLEDAQRVEKERSAHLVELEKLMKFNASDEELKITIDKLEECCRQISIIGECHWGMLISPTFVHRLVKSGFFENTQHTVTSQTDSSSLAQFANNLILSIPNMTVEQKNKINTIASDYYENLQELEQERLAINEEITVFFAQPGEQKKEDLQKVLQMVSTLELLRSNLSKEAAKWEDYSGYMMDLLTIRQRAQFYLDAEFQHKSVMQLKAMWDSLRTANKGNTQ